MTDHSFGIPSMNVLTEASQFNEKHAEFIEYLKKLSQKILRTKHFNIPIMEEVIIQQFTQKYHQRLQEILFEVQLQLQQIGLKIKAGVINEISVTYSELITQLKLYFLKMDNQNQKVKKKRSQSQYASINTYLPDEVGLLGGSHINHIEKVEGTKLLMLYIKYIYSKTYEKSQKLIYSQKLNYQDPWYSKQSQEQLKQKVFKINQQDTDNFLIKPMKLDVRQKILVNKSVATDDIETKIKELMLLQQFDTKQMTSNHELQINQLIQLKRTKEMIVQKREELKYLKNSSTYDELMRMIKWLNQKNGINEQWISAESRYEMPAIDLDRLNTEQIEQHLTENYSYIQKSSLDIIIKHIKNKRKNQRIQISQKQDPKKEIQLQEKIDKIESEKRKIQEKNNQIRKKLNEARKELIQKEKNIEKFQQLAQHWQTKLYKEQNRLLSDFQSSLIYRNYVNQLESDKKKKFRFTDIIEIMGNPQSVSANLNDFEFQINKLKEKFDEAQKENMLMIDIKQLNRKLNEIVSELNQKITIQEIEYFKRMEELKNQSKSMPRLLQIEEDINDQKRQRSNSEQKQNRQEQQQLSELIKIQIFQETKQQQPASSIQIKQIVISQKERSLRISKLEQLEFAYNYFDQNISDKFTYDADLSIQMKDSQEEIKVQGKINLSTQLMHQILDREKSRIQSLKLKNDHLSLRLQKFETMYQIEKFEVQTQTDDLQLLDIQLTNQLIRLKLEQESSKKEQDNFSKNISQYSTQQNLLNEQQQLTSIKEGSDHQNIFNTNSIQKEHILNLQQQQEGEEQKRNQNDEMNKEKSQIYQQDKIKRIYLEENKQFNQKNEPRKTVEDLLKINNDHSKEHLKIAEFSRIIQNTSFNDQNSQNTSQQNNNGKITKIRSLTYNYVQMQRQRDQGEQIQSSIILEPLQVQKVQESQELKHSEQQSFKHQFQEFVKVKIENAKNSFIQEENVTQQLLLGPTQNLSFDLKHKSKSQENIDPHHQKKIEQLNKLLLQVQLPKIDQQQSLSSMIKTQHYQTLVQNQQQKKKLKVDGNALTSRIERRRINNQSEERNQNKSNSRIKQQNQNQGQSKDFSHQYEEDINYPNLSTENLNVVDSPRVRYIFNKISESQEQFNQEFKSIISENGEWNYEKFKSVFKMLVRSHKFCGENCNHLQRFYSRFGIIYRQPKNRSELKMNLQKPMPFGI